MLCNCPRVNLALAGAGQSSGERALRERERLAACCRQLARVAGRELSQSRQPEAGGGGWFLAPQALGGMRKGKTELAGVRGAGTSPVFPASLGLSPEFITPCLLLAPFWLWN